jgi:hypothetical protein
MEQAAFLQGSATIKGNLRLYGPTLLHVRQDHFNDPSTIRPGGRWLTQKDVQSIQEQSITPHDSHLVLRYLRRVADTFALAGTRLGQLAGEQAHTFLRRRQPHPHPRAAGRNLSSRLCQNTAGFAWPSRPHGQA